MSYIDFLVTALVICAVLWSAHRLGQANPVGTGRLVRRMDLLEKTVTTQGEKIDGLESAMQTLAKTAGETSVEIAAMRLEIAGDRSLSERTWGAVNRIQEFFIEDAFERRRKGE